ncbi:MAG: hypothetical protein M5R42_11295 [Rhodocyclaceae bacterium]|nr:hypothetical protein [Rhodocyclaceae bacterium]
MAVEGEGRSQQQGCRAGRARHLIRSDDTENDQIGNAADGRGYRRHGQEGCGMLFSELVVALLD